MAKAPAETIRTFRSARGEELKGSFVSGGDASPVVVLAHGYTSNRNSCKFGQIATALAAAGISTYRFDHPMAVGGLSERKGPFRMGNHNDEVADIHAAVTFLGDEGERVVGVLGHSKGGCNVVKYAAEHGDDCPPLIVNLAGRFCPGRASLEKRFGKGILERLQENGPMERREPWGTWTMTYEDLQERLDLPMDDYAAAIAANQRVTLLCIHGREDTVVDPSDSERCAELSGSRIILVEGADHNFSTEEAGLAMIQSVTAFFTSSR